MTASLEERLLPILIMLFASMISAIIPLYALHRRRLNFKRDIIFIFFWFQTWIYLHLVPLLNVMFAESEFAFPAQSQGLRAVSFTGQTCLWYGFFQILCVILFYVPMVGAFLLLNSKRSLQEVVIASDLCRHRWRLLSVALFYSSFSMLAIYIAVQNNALSAYAELITGQDLWSGQLPAWQYYTYRVYLLSGMFLTLVMVVSLYERYRQGGSGTLMLFCAALPGLLAEVVWIFLRSRGLLAFTLALVFVILMRRGYI